MEEAQVSSYNHCYHHSECVCVSVYVSSCRLLGIGVSWIFMMEPLVETAAWETRAPPPHTHTLMATAAGRESVCLSASGWDTQQQRRFVANMCWGQQAASAHLREQWQTLDMLRLDKQEADHRVQYLWRPPDSAVGNSFILPRRL